MRCGLGWARPGRSLGGGARRPGGRRPPARPAATTLVAIRFRGARQVRPGRDARPSPVTWLLKTRARSGHTLPRRDRGVPGAAAGRRVPDREAGLAVFLVVDDTVGFAVSSARTAVNEQRVRTRRSGPSCTSSSARCPRTLPGPRRLGEHVWLDNRDERPRRRARAGTALVPQADAGANDDDHRTTTRRREDARQPADRGPSGGGPMSIAARCGSCNRELPLAQLVQPSDGLRCLSAASPSRWRPCRIRRASQPTDRRASRRKARACSSPSLVRRPTDLG
jgi:hypothetical protein